MNPRRILVLGIGNTLLSDDGAGVHAVSLLQEQGHHLPPQVHCVDGGTLSFSLIPTLLDSDALIALDATALALEPGAITLLSGAAMDEFITKGRHSVHEVALGDLLDVTHLLGHQFFWRALIGIQTHSLGWGHGLTPQVARAIPRAAAAAVTLIHHWCTPSQPKLEDPHHASHRIIG